jgi:hypothetical protein
VRHFSEGSNPLEPRVSLNEVYFRLQQMLKISAIFTNMRIQHITITGVIFLSDWEIEAFYLLRYNAVLSVETQPLIFNGLHGIISGKRAVHNHSVRT